MEKIIYIFVDKESKNQFYCNIDRRNNSIESDILDQDFINSIESHIDSIENVEKFLKDGGFRENCDVFKITNGQLEKFPELTSEESHWLGVEYGLIDEEDDEEDED